MSKREADDAPRRQSVAPVITEKATAAVGAQPGGLPGVAATPPSREIKAAVERLFKVKVKAVNTLIRKGKTKRFRAIRAPLSDVKKAIVTLAKATRST